MNYKKVFFPIGGGEELESRLYGAFLIAKHLKINLEVLKSNISMYNTLSIPENILNKIDEIIDAKCEEENLEFENMFKQIAKEVGVKISEEPFHDQANIYLTIKDGIRSNLIEQDSKFCDLVIAAAPPSGIATATFDSAITKSGKPVLMFPRKMKKFKLDSVIIGWNNSPEVSSAVTSAIEILKDAQRVHIVSSKDYTKDEKSIPNLIKYLACHGVDASYELIETTRTPGEALLTSALDGNFDVIVAGAYGHKGLKELMLGGATKYLLENSTLPVFMSN